MKRILWFRRDLRVKDNPLLSLGGEVLPIFIFDANILEKLPADDKRVSFIFFYVKKLQSDLKKIGLDLKVFYGKLDEIFDYLLEKENFDEVVATGDYDSYAKERDLHISHKLHFRYIQDTYIFKHNEVLKDDGSPCLVFTPFYKKARVVLQKKDISQKSLATHSLTAFDYEVLTKIAKNTSTTFALTIENIGFESVFLEIVNPYEKLHALEKKLAFYQEQRDYLFVDATSHLSVDLRFGTIGVREIVRFLFENEDLEIEPFLRQLIFRDYYAYLLFHFPRLEKENFKYSFNGIENEETYKLFCEGKTGIPIVDAGVRELLQTGNMHNRVRMVVASFFTKDLLLPWQWGEVFFAKHLLDYDKASNVLSWQWSAGTGVDPQPYFRVFNPYLQSKKFDKDAVYIKKFVPALQDIDPKQLHNEAYLLSYDINGYHKPIVQHKEAAKNAIAFFESGIL